MDVERNPGLIAKLVLNDGTVLKGEGFGFSSITVGEIVFNTGMVGYTESLTDPSYRGQILCFTYPLIGNYGVPEFRRRDKYNLPVGFESESIQVSGVIVNEICEKPSHWASKITLNEWLKQSKVSGIYGIDTRELTKKIRVHGVMMSILEVSKEPSSDDFLIKKLENNLNYNDINFVEKVSVKEPVEYGVGDNKVVLIDCGVKLNIVRELLRRGLKVIRVPHDTSSRDILDFQPRGVIVSNGPGNPKQCVKTVRTVNELFDESIPLLGICLGTQIIGLALGGDTYKLKYGHRGQNKPCIDLGTLRSYVTSQNHGYAINPKSLEGTGLKPWFVNADDKTIEGLKHKNGRCISVQFHPEASPGPNDTEYVFDEFLNILKGDSSE
ncbi:MAG: glutamine-hydrolyzing carbamoyl-phosphate synthase small subunit [Nitrososphaerales archaeon]|jgi:carbamoyl-phosphate synthase small subunit|nr:glutamine-hydrolyzing carbamoyl-phosphate synthase small subunit [Nitrososphaerales archaeon]|tara:strand:- start:537 stop:1682 length:1146 start_codon:yes stop_codon:yes gene_type:complete